MATAGSSAVRDRILDAATRRFYASGIRSVSADRLIADAAISKVTFYRHFRSKDDLVEAYLARIAAQERGRVERKREVHPGNPAAVLRWYATEVGAASCTPGFRSCPFINAAAEYAIDAGPLTQGAWTDLEIPITQPGFDLTTLRQLKFDTTAAGRFYLDNIYFH